MHQSFLPAKIQAAKSCYGRIKSTYQRILSQLLRGTTLEEEKVKVEVFGKTATDMKFLVTFESLWEFVSMAAALKLAVQFKGDLEAAEMIRIIEKSTGVKV